MGSTRSNNGNFKVISEHLVGMVVVADSKEYEMTGRSRTHISSRICINHLRSCISPFSLQNVARNVASQSKGGGRRPMGGVG
tara:strand:+ start:389 stop:634 length:246 start_codon:yes stop_codon:yes gene_type:complete